MSFLEIRWHADAEKNSADILDINAMKRRNGKVIKHVVLGGRGGRYFAKCKVSVSRRGMELNYGGRSKQFNLAQGMDIGVMRIVGDDDVGYEVFWKDEGGKVFQKANVSVFPRNESLPSNNGSELSLEGVAKLVTHWKRERDPSLRRDKLASVCEKGRLKCEACKLDFVEIYGENGESACEVHHAYPIARGSRRTHLSRLHVLCASCHRVTHGTDPMPTVAQLSKRISQNRRRRTATRVVRGR